MRKWPKKDLLHAANGKDLEVLQTLKARTAMFVSNVGNKVTGPINAPKVQSLKVSIRSVLCVEAKNSFLLWLVSVKHAKLMMNVVVDGRVLPDFSKFLLRCFFCCQPT